MVRTQEAAAPLDAAPGTFVVETDGVMVRYQSGWHEVKLGVIGGQVDGALRALSYVAARQTAEEFGPRLLAEAARRGAFEIVGWDGPITGNPLAQLRSVVVLGVSRCAHLLRQQAAAQATNSDAGNPRIRAVFGPQPVR